MTDIDKYLNTDNWFDYQWFYKKMVEKGYTKFVEVGVWKGHSISYLANLLKNVENVSLFAVDLFENSYKYSDKDSSANKDLRKQIPLIYDIYNKNLENDGVRDMITDLKGYSWEAAKKVDDLSVDVVFIDADHTYESVKKDITAWAPKVRNGGILAGHDYRPGNPVAKAVDEFNSKFWIPNGWKLNVGRGSVWYVKIQ